MDAALLDKLADLGPWGIAVAVVIFLRKEIGTVLSAPRNDRAAESLMKSNNQHLEQNVALFEETTRKLDAIRGTLAEILAVAREINKEQVRK